MAAEVVGTAFVRIRALTTGLAKDMERGMKKGAADADVDSSGALVGDKFAKSAGAKIKSGLEDSVNDTTKNIDKKVDVDGGRRAGDRLGEAIKGGLTSTFDKTRSQLAKILGLDESEGKKSGNSFGKGFSGGIRGNLLKIGALFSPAILGAGSALLQYAVALTAQIGLLAQAAAGAGAVMGGAFGVALLAIAPLILAFKTETPRLKKFQDLAKKVGGQWKEVGAATQQTLLPGLGDALKLTTKLIPIARGWGREVGRVAGEHAKVLATLLTSTEGQSRLRSILQQSSPILDRMFDIGVRLVDILLNLFEAVLPSTQRFVDILDQIVARWQLLIQIGADNGTLAATFKLWRERADLVVGALGDVLGAIWDIFTVGANDAVPFFENFAQWAEDFRNWTESSVGQNKLAQIFSDAHEVASAFNGLIGDIIGRIGSAVFEPGGNDGILGFIGVLREDVVPFLDDFIRDISGKYGDALTDFFETFGDLLRVLGEGDTIKVTLQTLTLTLQALTETLETLMKIPGFSQFLSFLLGIAGAFAILKSLGVVNLVTTLAGAIGVLAGGFANLFAGGSLLAGLGGPIIGGGATVAIAGVAAAIAAVVAAIAAVIIVWKNWDTIVAGAKAAWGAFTRFLKDPMKRIIQLKENIEDLLGSLGDILGRAGRAAGRALAGLAGIIGRAIGGALSAAGRQLSKLPGIIGRALSGLAGAAVDALADFGSTVIDAILSGLAALPGLLRQAAVTAIQVAINALFLYIVGIPWLIVKALQFLGPIVGRFLADAFGVAVRFVTETIPTAFGAVIDFFQKLPGRLAGALGALGRAIADVFVNAWNSLTEWLTGTAAPATLDFFRKLPGRIVGAMVALRDNIVRIFRDAMDAGQRIVSSAIDGIVDFFRKLPGRILGFIETLRQAALDVGGAVLDGIVDALGGALDFAGDVASAVGDALRSAINAVIRFLNDAIPDKLGHWPLEINLPDNPIPELAMGGIFSRPTNAIIGEDGREVVIPLTRPQRALELFNQSGLASVLDKARRANSSTTNTTTESTTTSGRDLTVIQNFHEKQDPKLMASELAWQLP